jgi:hypothetical protein
LRYREEGAFRALLEQGGLRDIVIERATAALDVASPRWLAERIAFAPGMAALLARLGSQRDAVLAAFVDRLETTRGQGPITLRAVASIGSGRGTKA